VNPRKLLRIAKWEVTKNAGGVDRRTLAVVAVSIALFGLLAPFVAGGVGLDDGLYRVGVDTDSPYYEVVAADDTFVVRPPDSEAFEDGSLELLVEGERIEHAPTAKGLAAREELRSSVRRYNDRNLRQESNRSAAFPVSVALEYRNQEGLGDTLRVDGESDDADGERGDVDGENGGTDDGIDTGSGDSTEDGSGGTGDGDADRATGAGGGGSGFGGIGTPLSEGGATGSPADISPPFPFQSLVLAFLFIIPLNFVIQAYGSTMLSERINRRGELLLVSPVSRFDIVAGKTLPYFLGAVLVEAAIAVGLVFLVRGEPGGLVSVLAVTPLVGLFLGATFLGAMFARSFKELTFVTVTITVSLTSYAFVPAIFTDVGPVALISPLTLVVRDLQNQAVTLGEFVFSTTPPLLAGLVCFGLGAGLYREEDMFDQRSISGKVLDALAGPVSRPWHVGGMTAALVPFVFVVELVAIAMLFALGEISIVLILAVVAVVEEIAKSLHVYASYEHRRFGSGFGVALGLGVASGVGFFFAEKVALLAQLVGLPELRIGEAALQGAVPSGPLLVAFLLAPLVLHVVTASISAAGASRGLRAYLLALVVAVAVHFAYNLTVVTAVV